MLGCCRSWWSRTRAPQIPAPLIRSTRSPTCATPKRYGITWTVPTARSSSCAVTHAPCCVASSARIHSRSIRTRACLCRTARARCWCATARRCGRRMARRRTICRTCRVHRSSTIRVSTGPICRAGSPGCACGSRSSCTVLMRFARRSTRSAPSRSTPRRGFRSCRTWSWAHRRSCRSFRFISPGPVLRSPRKMRLRGT